jgi:uncharacterized membrane protein YkvA (DUF1232 family)
MMGRLRRAIALLADPRVRRLPRAAVLLAVLYTLVPVDLFPDFLVPVAGYLDDAVLLWLSLRWLTRSAPTTAPVPTGGPSRP